MEEKETKYKYAIVYTAPDKRKKEDDVYIWGKRSKYRTLEAAEMALKALEDTKILDFIYRIVPYFEGHWWKHPEKERQAYLRTNLKIWEFVKIKGLEDEFRKYLQK